MSSSPQNVFEVESEFNGLFESFKFLYMFMDPYDSLSRTFAGNGEGVSHNKACPTPDTYIVH